jgi:hypothetical protein
MIVGSLWNDLPWLYNVFRWKKYRLHIVENLNWFLLVDEVRCPIKAGGFGKKEYVVVFFTYSL